MPCYLFSVWHVLQNCGGPNARILKTTPWSPSSSHVLSHHHVPLHRATRCFYFNKSNQTSCFLLVFFFITAKIPRAAGGKPLKTPQALGFTSKQLSSFFTHCFQDPCLFSPGNQILLEIFLSDITIYRTLALDIMFISDLYMSTWPIKFIRGLESFSLFVNLSPAASL